MDMKAVEITLNNMRDSIVERMEKLAKHTQHREEPIPQDFSEQAVSMENDETMVALEEELQANLSDVEAALARLEAGEYGQCRSCQEPISAARLDALPAAVLCIECASAAD